MPVWLKMKKANLYRWKGVKSLGIGIKSLGILVLVPEGGFEELGGHFRSPRG